jgi:hypothetical protein
MDEFNLANSRGVNAGHGGNGLSVAEFTGRDRVKQLAKNFKNIKRRSNSKCLVIRIVVLGKRVGAALR